MIKLVRILLQMCMWTVLKRSIRKDAPRKSYLCNHRSRFLMVDGCFEHTSHFFTEGLEEGLCPHCRDAAGCTAVNERKCFKMRRTKQWSDTIVIEFVDPPDSATLQSAARENSSN